MSIVVKDENLSANLPDVLKAVKSGNEVVITSGNVPFAKFVPMNAPMVKRTPGTMPGLLSLPDEFYEPLSDDELAAWE